VEIAKVDAVIGQQITSLVKNRELNFEPNFSGYGWYLKSCRRIKTVEVGVILTYGWLASLRFFDMRPFA
jgi:hypothetical protein